MAVFSLSNKCFVPAKCFSTASRCSASSASDLLRELISIPPRSVTCGPSGPPSPCRPQRAGLHQAVLADEHTRCQRRPRREETSCRLLPVHQIGWCRRGVKQAQPQGNTREATTFTAAFSMDRGPLDMLVQIVQVGKTLSCRRNSGRCTLFTSHRRTAGQRRRTCSSRPHSTTFLNPSNEGLSWILLWDCTMTAMKAAFPHVVLCFIPPRSTSHLQPCNLTVFRSFKSCIQEQASATVAGSVVDGSFDVVVMNRAWRRQSSAEWAARAVTDLCNENHTWTTGWRRLRAHSDDEFCDAMMEAAALHARDELFAKHTTPEPIEGGLPAWIVAEESDDDEDDAPMLDVPASAEPKLTIPRAASCTATFSVSLSVDSCVLCFHVHHVLTTSPRLPGSQTVTDKTGVFLFLSSVLL